MKHVGPYVPVLVIAGLHLLIGAAWAAEAKAEAWLELNREYSDGLWPNITRKGEPPADAETYKGMEGKYEKFFSREPGKTDG